MKIPEIPGKKSARLAQGKAGLPSNEANSGEAKRMEIEMDLLCGTSIGHSSHSAGILEILNGAASPTPAEVEKILRSIGAEPSRGAQELPGAELLLPGAELLPIEPPQAPVTAFGGPFEWEWNLFPKPGCNESRS